MYICFSEDVLELYSEDTPVFPCRNGLREFLGFSEWSQRDIILSEEIYAISYYYRRDLRIYGGSRG